MVDLLLLGINDSREDLARLARMFAGRPAGINLMCWNPVKDIALPRTDDRRLAAFRAGLDGPAFRSWSATTQGRNILPPAANSG